MDWLASIRALPPGDRYVDHEPPDTERYARARSKLRYVVRECVFLGVLAVEAGVVEVAAWCPPGHGRGPGYYACFRVRLRGEVPLMAVLFCFYDGTDGSPAFRSEAAARAYAREQGFREDE